MAFNCLFQRFDRLARMMYHADSFFCTHETWLGFDENILICISFLPNRNSLSFFNRRFWYFHESESSQCTWRRRLKRAWQLLQQCFFLFGVAPKRAMSKASRSCGCNNKWKVSMRREQKAKCFATGDWVKRWIRWNENESESQKKWFVCFFFSNLATKRNAKNEKLYRSV